MLSRDPLVLSEFEKLDFWTTVLEIVILWTSERWIMDAENDNDATSC